MLVGVRNHRLVNPVFHRSTMDGLLGKHKVYIGLGGTSSSRQLVYFILICSRSYKRAKNGARSQDSSGECVGVFTASLPRNTLR